MYQENVVLCGASAYEQKYYFNQDFASLPESIKQELHIMCVFIQRMIGGILTLEFDDNGSLQFKTEALDSDAMYDDIGSVLQIQQATDQRRTSGVSGNVLSKNLFSLAKQSKTTWKMW